jgi:hypothetical protein
VETESSQESVGLPSGQAAALIAAVFAYHDIEFER